MTLPTTIISFGNSAGYTPPAKAANGAYYVVVLASGAWRVYKATDPSDSWSQVASVGMSASTTSLCISSVMAGNTLHIHRIYLISGSLYSIYNEFDCATDTEVSANTEQFEGGTASNVVNTWGSISVRDDGDIIIAYVGRTDNVMGGRKQRVDYARREGGSWTADIALDAAGDIHYGNPNVVKGASADEMHILWGVTTNTNDPPSSWESFEARTLDSGNSLSTLVTFDPAAPPQLPAMLGIQNGVSWDDAGTVRIAFPYGHSGSGAGDSRIFLATEDGSGDITGISNAILDTTVDTDVNGEVALVTIAEEAGNLHYLMSGGGNTGIDQDLYYSQSTDDGVTWDLFTEELDDITCNYISANIYVRGADTVLAYVYDDGGVQKYNEKILIAGGAGETSELPSAAITIVEFAPTIVTTENHIADLPSATIVVAEFAPVFEVFDPNISELPNVGITVASFVPTIVTSDNNFSELPSEVVTVASFVPTIVTTENRISLLAVASIAVAIFVPVFETFDPNTSTLPSTTIVVAEFAPVFEVADPNTSTLPSVTLTVTEFAPDATTTENNISQLVSGSISVATFVPQIVTTEGDEQFVNMATVSITAVTFVPVFEVFDPNTSTLPSEAITLVEFAPVFEVFDPNTSTLPSVVVTVAEFAPVFETFDPNTSTLPSAGVTVATFVPTIVTTEAGANEISQLPSVAITLAAFVPTIVTTENNISQLSGETLTLVEFAPVFEVFDPNTSTLPSAGVTVAAFVPTIVTTENHFSQLPSGSINLVTFAPQVVTTENHISLIGNVTLSVAVFVPQIIVTDPNISQLLNVALTVATFVPQFVATEGVAETSELPFATITVVEFVPTIVTTEASNNNISELPSVAITLTEFAPQVTAKRRILIVT